jgi:hypothetical protein
MLATFHQAPDRLNESILVPLAQIAPGLIKAAQPIQDGL